MDIIEIFFNRDNSIFDSINLTIDNIPVDYSIVDNIITINNNISYGIHKLRMSLLVNETRIEITDVKLNGSSLRQTIYLSYIENNGVKLQPATTLWEPTQIWILPFGNPVSFWLVETGHKIPNGDYGKNLYNDYLIYYPEPVKVNENHLPIIKDFFCNDFSITVIPKHKLSLKNIPYQHINLDIREDLLINVKNEIKNKIGYFVKHRGVAYENAQRYNQLDNESYDFSSWSRFTIMKRNNNGIAEYDDNTEDLHYTKELIKQLDIKDIYTVGLSITKPGAGIHPHIDNSNPEVELNNNINLQIPITDNDDAKLKVAGIGLIPLDEPFLFNNGIYYHSLVNEGNNYRVRLLIKFDPASNEKFFFPKNVLTC